MSRVSSLADHLAPDTTKSLTRAAEERIEDAGRLLAEKRFLAALYLFGYSVEMVLAAAYFRSAGFLPSMPIDRETRHRHMVRARQMTMETGEPLMDSDPHPLVGWARSLQRQRSASPDLTARQVQLLANAVDKAEMVYKHWRPELRYKTAQVTEQQIEEVRKSAIWFNQHRAALAGRD